MRFRSLSLGLLASSTLAALLGCPLDGAPSSDATANADPDATGTRPANTASHDDAVDAPLDLSWAQPEELPPGTAALRVLMTDAPIAADNVFVTFCGIYVELASPGLDPHVDGAGRRDPMGGEADAGAPDPRAEAERSEAERAEAERAEAERAEAEGEAARRDGREAPPAEAGPRDPERAERERADAERQRVDAERERADAERERADAERERAAAERGGEAERERADAERERGGVRGAADAGAAESPEPGREAARRAGWHTISDECQTLDLLTLRDGITEAVGITALPPGEYGQLRLMLTKATIVIDGLEHELIVPSGAESGLKIGHGFTLADGAATTITVDFDAGRSVHYAPGRGFIMAPVIDVIDVQSREGVARDPEGQAGQGSERTPRTAPRPEGAAGSSAEARSDDAARMPPRK